MEKGRGRGGMNDSNCGQSEAEEPGRRGGTAG